MEAETQRVLLAEARRLEADRIIVGSGLSPLAADAECSVEIVRQAWTGKNEKGR